MSARDFHPSRLGLWTVYAGLALCSIVLVTATAMAWRPEWFAGQQWTLLLFPMTLAAIALVLGGLRWWGSFRLAERIAARARTAEQANQRSLATLVLPVLFGGGMLLFAMRGQFSNMLVLPEGGITMTRALEMMVISAPVIVFAIATLILTKNRSQRSNSIADQLASKQAEARQSKWLLIAAPALILVPYLAWVALQPPVEPYVPEHRHR